MALAVFWIVVVGWLFWNMQAHGVDPEVLQSDAAVRVVEAPTSITFTPAVDTASVALAFYPGALVQPKAYVPMARAVAAHGYAVVIVELPYRLAPLESQQDDLAVRTLALIRGDERHRAWVVGGHSRGGALAAQLARDHADAMAGLLLVGTSHPRKDDLSGLAIDVTKIYATEDGLASEEEVHDFARNLPDDTHFVRIEGGNHTQFAWYSWQLGDGRARISREEQQRILIDAIVAALRRVAIQRDDTNVR